MGDAKHHSLKESVKCAAELKKPTASEDTAKMVAEGLQKQLPKLLGSGVQIDERDVTNPQLVICSNTRVPDKRDGGIHQRPEFSPITFDLPPLSGLLFSRPTLPTADDPAPDGEAELCT
jgi:hypothetical protein